jgi:LysR family glycine cleavage system transcriptional activator
VDTLRHLPPLQLLLAFEAAGRTGSFKEAARELHVTPSAISQQIKALEDVFHVTFFERRGRSTILTDEGERYWGEVHRTLLDLSAASRRVHRRGRGQELRINSSDFFVYDFILPRLSSLRARLPGFDLRFESNSDLIDFEGREVDGAIRIGGGPWPGLVAHEIGSATACAVCSPALAARMRRGSDLLKTTLIELRGFEHRGLLASLKAAGHTSEPPVCMVDSVLEMLLAAEQGIGVGFALFPLATEWVMRGRLAVPFRTRMPLSAPVSLVHPRGDGREVLGTLVRWLREEYARLPSLPVGRLVAGERPAG